MHNNIAPCPCGSNRDYSKCCQPYHTQKRYPNTAKALMRSRYSAYALILIDYIQLTANGQAKAQFDYQSAKQWAENCTFLQLRILSTRRGKREDNIGWVEFEVDFEDSNGRHTMHELSQFNKIQGKWYYVANNG